MGDFWQEGRCFNPQKLEGLVSRKIERIYVAAFLFAAPAITKAMPL